ncbi:hypothetical protein SAMN04487885_101172 [Clostridium cadaveris]|uniref:Uncharacterized protein n=1 Tax=Clostridium cadaveris TaxID=1529 RepID=A0A1I2J764_9CLOT|nr:hypothetical protein SAMN04487885_101172 [Clostridium cadaveris]
MTPEEISKELIHLHDNYGMTYSFVAKKIKISRLKWNLCQGH